MYSSCVDIHLHQIQATCRSVSSQMYSILSGCYVLKYRKNITYKKWTSDWDMLCATCMYQLSASVVTFGKTENVRFQSNEKVIVKLDSHKQKPNSTSNFRYRSPKLCIIKICFLIEKDRFQDAVSHIPALEMKHGSDYEWMGKWRQTKARYAVRTLNSVLIEILYLFLAFVFKTRVCVFQTANRHYIKEVLMELKLNKLPFSCTHSLQNLREQ
jgi:hypothetical protein